MNKNSFLKCRVDEPFKQAFKRASVANGFSSESGLLLELATYAIKQSEGLPEQETMDNERKGRWIGVRINDQEAKAIAVIIENENYKNNSEFLLSLVRSRITKSPFLNESEVNQLEDSKYQLMAIGRNLNQMVKAINEGRADGARFTERYANEIIDRMATLKREINHLVKTSTSREA